MQVSGMIGALSPWHLCLMSDIRTAMGKSAFSPAGLQVIYL